MLPTYARHHGAAVVEINPNPTRLTERVDFALRGPAGVALPALVAAVWPGAPLPS
jgi:NAD-dependent deacetylase